MIDEKKFKTLTRVIVVDNFPNEILAFDIAADDLIKQLRIDGNIEAMKKKESQVNFMEQATGVLSFIAVLISTYKAIVEIKSLRLKAKLDKQVFEKNWISFLQDAGVPKKKIDKILSKNLKDVLKYFEE
jgi:hypothetical protein